MKVFSVVDTIRRASPGLLLLWLAGVVHPTALDAASTPTPTWPTVYLRWDSPEGPTHRSFDGAGPVDLFVVLRGQREAFKAHQIWLVIASEIPCCRLPPELAPAWRFDPGGCQDGRLCLEHRPFLRFIAGQPGEQHFEIVDIARDSISRMTRIVVAEVNFPQVQLHPDSSYVLFRLRFDHSRTVLGDEASPGSCAGAHRQAVIWSTTASYVRMDGTEVEWAKNNEAYWEKLDLGSTAAKIDCTCAGEDPRIAIGDLTSTQSSISSCSEVPVGSRPTTWGRVKSSYR